MIDNKKKKAKKHHGVLLYDVLLQRHCSDAKAPLPVENFEAAFVAAMEDMKELSDKLREKDDMHDALEAMTEQANRDFTGVTAGDKAKHAGNKLKDSATRSKLKADMAYYRREMKIRKEIFGLQLFDDLPEILAHEGSFEEGMDGVGAALNRAKDDIHGLMDKTKEKEEAMKALSGRRTRTE